MMGFRFKWRQCALVLPTRIVILLRKRRNFFVTVFEWLRGTTSARNRLHAEIVRNHIKAKAMRAVAPVTPRSQCRMPNVSTYSLVLVVREVCARRLLHRAASNGVIRRPASNKQRAARISPRLSERRRPIKKAKASYLGGQGSTWPSPPVIAIIGISIHLIIIKSRGIVAATILPHLEAPPVKCGAQRSFQ